MQDPAEVSLHAPTQSMPIGEPDRSVYSDDEASLSGRAQLCSQEGTSRSCSRSRKQPKAAAASSTRLQRRCTLAFADVTMHLLAQGPGAEVTLMGAIQRVLVLLDPDRQVRSHECTPAD